MFGNPFLIDFCNTGVPHAGILPCCVAAYVAIRFVGWLAGTGTGKINQ